MRSLLDRKFDTLKDALASLSKKAGQSTPTEIDPKALLQTLGECIGCDWGTYWKVDSKLLGLTPAGLWHRKGIDTRTLELHTERRTLSMSEGTAGHVWRTKKPIWTVDLITDMCLPRSLDAQSAGLRGGIWFAVKTGTAVYGVIELLGSDIPPPSPELIDAIENLGLQIGRAVEQSSSHDNAT